MHYFLSQRLSHLKIRWKLLIIILPLIIVPIFALGAIIGYVATRQAMEGLTEVSRADLDHMASFTLDLLDSHHRQFEVYRQDKKQIVEQEMKSLVDLAGAMIGEQQRQLEAGLASREQAQQAIRNSFREVSIGSSGYLFAMTGSGTLTVHPTREKENIAGAQDENGRFFIQEMLQQARLGAADQVHYTIYPWINEQLGDKHPRNKIVAYRYWPEWDWIIAAGGYLDETYDDPRFEEKALALLKQRISSKKVGQTGYIYCLNRNGTLTIHPDAEGENLINATDADGHAFIAEMAAAKEGWIRYPWRGTHDSKARMKIVRYRYFEPWDWIVAVGSYEDEFYHTANAIKWRIALHVLLLPLVIGLVATALLALASKVLTDPIQRMIEVIRQIKQGRLDKQIPVDSQDELGELAIAFNRMTRMLRKNRELESALAQQGKMASLGVLSSGVAHEINNPLGVILGYAGYLEKKIPEDDPHFTYISEIKRESKRCKKIVQDLLSYARTPKPVLEPVDVNRLLHQIIDFAGNHTDLHHVTIVRDFTEDLPPVPADADQLRQVAINLLLNAGAASPAGSPITVSTRLESNRLRIAFSDQGEGISEENLDKIFEPFFTTKARGTGLGLAITRQIIEMHQGQVFIDSVAGQGTTVVILLPLQRDDQP